MKESKKKDVGESHHLSPWAVSVLQTQGMTPPEETKIVTAAHLDYLERKMAAADRLANEFRVGYGWRASRLVAAYDELLP